MGGAQRKKGNEKRGGDGKRELLQAPSGAAQKTNKPAQRTAAERREALCRVKGRQERR